MTSPTLYFHRHVSITCAVGLYWLRQLYFDVGSRCLVAVLTSILKQPVP